MSATDRKIMRASKEEYLKARNSPRPPRFMSWAREYLASSTSETEYYDFAMDLSSYIPPKIDDRKAFDREAMKFVAEYPNKAFRRIQEEGIELSTPDLVTMVKKNVLLFIPLLTTEQKLQYKGAGERLLRVTISLNRDKLTKQNFIQLSQLHDLNKIAHNKQYGHESPLYSDHIYQKYMKQVMSEHYDISDMEAKELWPHWLEFLEQLPIE